jgi:nucleotide-binding universal stress UspA family protein
MIPQIKRILYATDLSKNSSYAFLYATNMAKKYGAEIVILHVIEPVPPYVEVYGGITVEIQQKQQGEIVEEKLFYDLVGLMRQIGLM